MGVQAQPERGDRMRRQKVNTIIESKIRSLKTGVHAQPGRSKQGQKETGHGVQAQPDNKPKEAKKRKKQLAGISGLCPPVS